MKIDVVRPLDLGPAELDAWRAIQAARPHMGSPYLAPEWALTLARSGGPDARSGRVAVLRQDGGRPAGFFPVRAGPFTALPLGAPLCDYQAVVAEEGVRVDAADLARALRVQRLDLYNTLTDSPGLGAHLRVFGESHIIDLANGFDAYAAERKAAGSNILADTAKKKRRLEKEVGAAVFTAQSASREDWDTAVAWKRAQYGATRQTDIFATPWVPAFLDRLRDEAGDRFGAHLFTLHADGRLVATHIALTNGPVLHAWFIAHDEEAQRHSPGVILIVEMLRWAAARGMREFDLGPGAYRFKTSLANASRPVGHGFAGRASAALAGRWAQYRVRRAAESLPLGRFSHLPGKAMRRMDLWRGLHQG